MSIGSISQVKIATIGDWLLLFPSRPATQSIFFYKLKRKRFSQHNLINHDNCRTPYASLFCGSYSESMAISLTTTWLARRLSLWALLVAWRQQPHSSRKSKLQNVRIIIEKRFQKNQEVQEAVSLSVNRCRRKTCAKCQIVQFHSRTPKCGGSILMRMCVRVCLDIWNCFADWQLLR